MKTADQVRPISQHLNETRWISNCYVTTIISYWTKLWRALSYLSFATWTKSVRFSVVTTVSRLLDVGHRRWKPKLMVVATTKYKTEFDDWRCRSPI